MRAETFIRLYSVLGGLVEKDDAFFEPS